MSRNKGSAMKVCTTAKLKFKGLVLTASASKLLLLLTPFSLASQDRLLTESAGQRPDISCHRLLGNAL